MTKKDFELLALSLGISLGRTGESNQAGQAAIVRVVLDLAHNLEQTYPRFDSDRFLERVREIAEREVSV